MKQIIYIAILVISAGTFLAGEGIFFDNNDDFYAVVAGNSGLFVSEDGGMTWEERSRGLPQRVVYPEFAGGIKTMTAVAVGRETGEGRVILVSTSDRIFRSIDSGKSWNELPTEAPVKPADYFTALAAHPAEQDRIAVGTSFSGIIETADAGKSWKRHSDLLTPLYRGAGFYEEILGIGFSDDDFSAISFQTGYTRESFTLKDGNVVKSPGATVPVPMPQSVESLLARVNDTARTQPVHNPPREHFINRKGIYVNSVQAGGDGLDAHLDFCRQQGLDSIVIDFKDDNGIVTFDITYDMPRKIGAVRERIDLDTLITKVHSRGMYLIARIVVFKDKMLYQNDGFPVMDKNGGTWGKKFKITGEDGEIQYEQREFWVDPFNPDVWEYNALIAKELQDRGVDEIQFDYIRFPSDGDTSRAVYTSRKPGMTRIEALESFLIRVREDIQIPISTDLYGFNSWYRMGNWIGQNIDMLSNYVDVICPMFYPSHFPGGFLNTLPYLDRAEVIYREGSNRAAAIAGGRAVIRPYVQAFLLPSEYYMEKPEYTRYLNKQIKGTMESNASGFLLWNNSNRYYMVNGRLSEITKAKSNEDTISID